jgi:hypothetical protein
MPAQQRLDANQASIARVDLRLIFQPQLSALEDADERAFQRQSPPGPLAHRSRMKSKELTAARLRGLCGRVSSAQKLVERFAIAGKHADAHASSEVYVRSIHAERLLKGMDDAVCHVYREGSVFSTLEQCDECQRLDWHQRVHSAQTAAEVLDQPRLETPSWHGAVHPRPQLWGVLDAYRENGQAAASTARSVDRELEAFA